MRLNGESDAGVLFLSAKAGLDVSPQEWLTLLEALERGLHEDSLTGFYRLCRAALIKSETDYDLFDRAFAEFFQGREYSAEIPEEMMRWLNRPNPGIGLRRIRLDPDHDESLEELIPMMRERIDEQKEEHNCGSYWLGTMGYSPFGNDGYHPGGIRVGGKSQYRSAASVAGERRFRDFRQDIPLDIRQYQMAFRLLRKYSAHSELPKDEFDVEETIRSTCERGGLLSVRYRRPRKNTVRVLLLIDAGGSMEPHAALCSSLFQAATKSNHFRDLKLYYFHNCVYAHLFRSPMQGDRDAVSTQSVLKTCGKNWKLILVGDATMRPYEMTERYYDWIGGDMTDSGLTWAQRLRRAYPSSVWLNPAPESEDPYWSATRKMIAEVFPMYDLSLSGLQAALKELMSGKKRKSSALLTGREET